MTKEQAIEALKAIKVDYNDDTELAHVEADKVLCELLTALGHGDVVTEYNTIGKWYA
jgi:hypothetical protein